MKTNEEFNAEIGDDFFIDEITFEEIWLEIKHFIKLKNKIWINKYENSETNCKISFNILISYILTLISFYITAFLKKIYFKKTYLPWRFI